jgi:predicted XRE-type DNA-binding protein
MKEVWKKLVGYEGLYDISSRGRVKRLRRVVKIKKSNGSYYDYIITERILKNSLTTYGYYKISLGPKKDRKSVLVHRLVGITFLVNIDNKPQINHIDGDKTNNNVENLEWVTNQENAIHAHKTGLRKGPIGELNTKAKLKEKDILEIRSLLKNNNIKLKEVARLYGVSISTISAIKTRRKWKHLP